MALTRQQQRRRRCLRKVVEDNFDNYADAAQVFGYSESWVKSRLQPAAKHAIGNNAWDAIKARLAAAGYDVYALR